jgi:hypothetical protein
MSELLASRKPISPILSLPPFNELFKKSKVSVWKRRKFCRFQAAHVALMKSRKMYRSISGKEKAASLLTGPPFFADETVLAVGRHTKTGPSPSLVVLACANW